MAELLITGIPRTGSTYLYKSAAGLPMKNKEPIEYHEGRFIKTHSPCPPRTVGDQLFGLTFRHVEKNRKVIFTFGDVVQSVLSTRLRKWESNHFKNCGCTLDPETADNFAADILNYEIMFDSWMSTKYKEVALVRYEAIWDYRKDIENFLGRDIHWLPWKPRNAAYNTNIFGSGAVEVVKHTYASLIQKVNTAPDFKRNN